MSTIIDYVELIFDTARQNNLVLPLFVNVAHPIVDRHASLCLFHGVDTIGSGSSPFLAKNAAAREMWLRLGQAIHIDSM
jgi:hypothetical protein